jgi:UDP-N-acetylmuramate dehydrogenase
MIVTEVRERLRGRFKGTLEEGVPLEGLTTFRIGGPADLLALPQGKEDLAQLLDVVVEEGSRLLVLGKGSNVLISDLGFRGVVVVLGKGLSGVKSNTKHEVYVESGCELNVLAAWAIRRGLGGLEGLCGIPGSVGGAVRMNAGAMGSSISEVIEQVAVMRLAGSRVETKLLRNRDIAFTYRRTALEDRDIVYEVKMMLREEDREYLESRRKEVMRWRRENQPLKQPSAGSVFRNPPGMTAGELIDRCGLKGAREGGAMVSEKHANFIVNLGGARADDVYRLIARVKAEVHRREGVELEEEIRLVGEMGEDGG